jgi:hypothetical protein
MHYGTQELKNNRVFIRISLAVGVIMLGVAPAAGAVDTTVNTIICSAAPATLTIATPADHVTSGATPIIISGSVSRVSQIRVSIDGVYHETLPVDAGATTYSYSYVAGEGQHAVELVGVDVCQNGDATKIIHITYAPGAAQQPDMPTPVTPNDTGIAVGGQAAERAPEAAPVTLLNSTPVGRAVAGALYSALVGLDFASPSSFAQVPTMTGRFALTSVGLVATVFPGVILAGYKALQDSVLVHVLPNLPGVVVGKKFHAIIRVLGIGSLVIPIFFMV